MATRTVITADPGVYAAPGHNQTRFYALNEQHTIGSPLMPQGLSTALVDATQATEDSSTNTQTAQRALDAAALFSVTDSRSMPLAW